MESKRTSIGGSLLVPSVQELAKEPLIKVPSRYVRSHEDLPATSCLSSSMCEVPVIDMQHLLSGDSTTHELEKLHLACKDWGFFQRYPRRILDRNEEHFPHNSHIHCKCFEKKVEDIKILYDEGMQYMRMNYYPPCPEPKQVIGLSPHSDPLGITFLLQFNEVQGLQIKKDGNWIPVKPLPNSFIVNIGDSLEILTNGIYKRIEHKATVNLEKEGLSIATFLGPKLEGDLGPAPSLITSDTPPRFTRVSGTDFYKKLFSTELKSKTNLEQYLI